jgi:hypothetical protein
MKVGLDSLKNPSRPFKVDGKNYNRDEMKKLGLDKVASMLITRGVK